MGSDQDLSQKCLPTAHLSKDFRLPRDPILDPSLLRSEASCPSSPPLLQSPLWEDHGPVVECGALPPSRPKVYGCLPRGDEEGLASCGGGVGRGGGTGGVGTGSSGGTRARSPAAQGFPSLRGGRPGRDGWGSRGGPWGGALRWGWGRGIRARPGSEVPRPEGPGLRTGPTGPQTRGPGAGGGGGPAREWGSSASLSLRRPTRETTRARVAEGTTSRRRLEPPPSPPPPTRARGETPPPPPPQPPEPRPPPPSSPARPPALRPRASALRSGQSTSARRGEPDASAPPPPLRASLLPPSAPPPRTPAWLLAPPPPCVCGSRPEWRRGVGLSTGHATASLPGLGGRPRPQRRRRDFGARDDRGIVAGEGASDATGLLPARRGRGRTRGGLLSVTRAGPLGCGFGSATSRP